VGKDTEFDYGYNAINAQRAPRQSEMDSETSWSEASCTGAVKCTRCGKFHGYCDAVSLNKEKAEGMKIPAGSGASTRGPQFLNAKDVGRQCKAKIVEVGEAPGYMKYSDYAITLSINGDKFLRGERFGSMNTRAIVERYGDKTEKWKGKTITLKTQDWFNARTRQTQKIITVV